jgi:uncharacterized protein
MAFAVIMVASLIGINAALSKLPVTAALLQEARAGTLSISLLLTVDGIGFAAVVLFSKLASIVEGRPLGVYGLPIRDAFRKWFWSGSAWGFCLAFLNIGITHLLGGFTFGRFALSAGKMVRYGAGWAMVFILVGLFEEFLYRGYALQSLSDALGFWPATVLLSSLFGGLHLLNAGESFAGALNVFAYSLFACLTLRRTGSLWFAVGVHAAWDYSLTFLYSVPGSGMLAKGQMLDSKLQGPTWLTGGTAGPEGSVIGISVVLLSLLVFARLTRGSSAQRECTVTMTVGDGPS